MCDYFWQGDLSDVVRSGGLSSAQTADQSAAGWPELPDDPTNLSGPSADFIDDYGADATGGNTVIEASRAGGGGDMFSRVLQISPVVTAGGSVGEMQISLQGDLGFKRRKSQARKVVCIPAPVAANGRPGGGEVVPSDLWAWRKYGQKPIKGSPYPRGYYRCSSSKGCSARKQVERSRTDPNMLVITYTSEHNHPWPTQRNVLAGSTRSHIARNTTPNNNMNSSKSSNCTASTLKEENKATTPQALQYEACNSSSSSDAVLTGSSNWTGEIFEDLAEFDPFEERGKNKGLLDPFNMFDLVESSSLGETNKG